MYLRCNVITLTGLINAPPHADCFLIFCIENEKMNVKKVKFLLFHRKFENGPFLAKNDPKLAFLAQNGCFSHFSEDCALEFPIFFAGSLFFKEYLA